MAAKFSSDYSRFAAVVDSDDEAPASNGVNVQVLAEGEYHFLEGGRIVSSELISPGRLVAYLSF